MQSVVNGFFDQGEFEAVKTLSGHRGLHCDKHQFRAKMMVSTVCEYIVVEHSDLNKKEIYEKCYHTLCV